MSHAQPCPADGKPCKLFSIPHLHAAAAPLFNAGAMPASPFLSSPRADWPEAASRSIAILAVRKPVPASTKGLALSSKGTLLSLP